MQPTPMAPSYPNPNPQPWRPNQVFSPLNYGSMGGAALGYLVGGGLMGAAIGAAIGWAVYGVVAAGETGL